MDFEELGRRIKPVLEGTADRRSDVDLLVVAPENEAYLRRLDRFYDPLSIALGEPLDLFVYTPEEFERLKDRPFLRRVLSEGRVIYER